jgi:hypothetical protein
MSLQTQRNSIVISGAAEGTEAVATSGFLQEHGQIVGGVFSVLWFITVMISFKMISKIKEPNKNSYLIAPIILLLLTLIANLYYFTTIKKSKTVQDIQNAKSIYANITLVPIYLSIFAIVILITLR